MREKKFMTTYFINKQPNHQQPFGDIASLGIFGKYIFELKFCIYL